jgi:hypothetical protein
LSLGAPLFFWSIEIDGRRLADRKSHASIGILCSESSHQ